MRIINKDIQRRSSGELEYRYEVASDPRERFDKKYLFRLIDYDLRGDGLSFHPDHLTDLRYVNFDHRGEIIVIRGIAHILNRGIYYPPAHPPQSHLRFEARSDKFPEMIDKAIKGEWEVEKFDEELLLLVEGN